MINDRPEDAPSIPAPDFENFNVENDDFVAERLYARCKQIYQEALRNAIARNGNVNRHILVWREYHRAAEQLRHRYQSFWKRAIDAEDTVDGSLEPILTPLGVIAPTFMTMAEIHQQLFDHLSEHYPHLLPHWPNDRDDNPF